MPGAVTNGYDWDGRGYSRRTREDYGPRRDDPPRDYSLDRHARPTTPTPLWEGPSRSSSLPQSPRTPRSPGNEFGRQDSRPASFDSYQADKNGDSEGLQYEIDHLATFTVGSKTGLLHPEDGIRKLKLMDSTTGIWTMRCTLVLEPRHILIIDKQQSNEIERFPLSLVVDPTAMYNRDRKEVYNNLLLFTVLEDQKKRSSTPTEMHIFQIISSPAQDLVDEIKKFRQRLKEPLPPARDHYIPPHPQENAPEPPENGNGNIRVQDRVSNFNAMAAQTSDLRRVVARPQKRSSLARDGDDESTLSEKTDREVAVPEVDYQVKSTEHRYPTVQQVLNHCFDDIEKFVGRLQMAAEAYKELVRRKNNRGKNSKSKVKSHGDGMLGMRARPPPIEDFVDVFKKFKLAFNLLARLQPYIHDPNAPELIHFLFTPLSLIVDASKDPNIGMTDLVSRVVSPLLTTETKDLLTHCLSSKESEFWMALGEAWTLSRDQWHGYVPPYYPKFSDGWQPYMPGLNDSAAHANLSAAVMAHAAQVKRKEENDKAKTEAEDHVFQYPRQSDRQYNDTVYKEQQQRREEPERPYSPTPPPQTHRDLVGPDPRVTGYQAYVERHIDRNLSAQEEGNRRLVDADMAFDERQRNFYRELRHKNTRIYEVIHERTGRNSKELTVTKGEILELIDDSRNWWKMRNAAGDLGHAPYTILREYEGNSFDDTDGLSPREASNPESKGGRARYNNWTTDIYHREPEPYDHRDNGAMVMSPAPPPPPPPPIVPPVNAPLFDKKTKKEPEKPRQSEAKRDPKDDLHTELLQRMSMGKNRNVHKAMKPPMLYINPESMWPDVEEWLMSKSFSQRVIGALNGYTGVDIFNMSRRDIYEIAINRDEGHRLESQLTVQKNICGYGTLGSGELKAILRQRKKHAEDSPHPNQDRDYLGAPPDFVPATPDSLSTASVSSDDSNNPYRGQAPQLHGHDY